MARGVFQATIVDDLGNVVAGADVEVRDEASGDLVQLYDAITDGDELGNPVETDANGFVQFYAESGYYRITATLDAFEKEWRHVPIGAAASTSGEFDGTIDGFASDIDVTLLYKKLGHFVTLYSNGVSYTGTSNAGTMVFDGLPSELQPSFEQVVPCLITDNSGTVMGHAVVSPSSSEITLRVARTDTINDKVYPHGAFADSGTKGIPASFSMTYCL